MPAEAVELWLEKPGKSTIHPLRFTGLDPLVCVDFGQVVRLTDCLRCVIDIP